MYINESNLTFKSNMSYGNKPDSIVEHHAEAKQCSIYDIHQWHLDNGWAGCGYHFLVRKDGSIWRGRPENAVGSHCPGMNNHSIGICVEGDYMTETMPAAQRQSLIELGQYIKNKYGISNVYGHKEKYQTSCPGDNYPLQDIKNGIMNGQISNPVYQEPVITPKTEKLQKQVEAWIYWLNGDYNAKIKVRPNGAYVESELYPNIEAVGKLITLGHKSHLVEFFQQKLVMYGYLKTGSYKVGEYCKTTLCAVTELQKNWKRPTDGKILISNNTAQIFLQNE